jgi:transcriptional regulator with XRE-family HTH domain
MYERIVHGKKLRLLREQAGLPRRELAALLDYSEGHVKNIEIETGRRKKNPSRDQPSGEKFFLWIRLLEERLGRKIPLAEVSTPLDDQAAA